MEQLFGFGGIIGCEAAIVDGLERGDGDLLAVDDGGAGIGGGCAVRH